MIDSHNSQDLAEELAFERIEPTPDLNRWFARIMAMFYQIHGDGKRKWTEEDFMPGERTIKRREQPQQEIHNIFSAIAAARTPK